MPETDCHQPGARVTLDVLDGQTLLDGRLRGLTQDDKRFGSGTNTVSLRIAEGGKLVLELGS